MRVKEDSSSEYNPINEVEMNSGDESMFDEKRRRSQNRSRSGSKNAQLNAVNALTKKRKYSEITPATHNAEENKHALWIEKYAP